MVQIDMGSLLLYTAASEGGAAIIRELNAMIEAESPSMDDPRWRSAVAAAHAYIQAVYYAAAIVQDALDE